MLYYFLLDMLLFHYLDLYILNILLLSGMAANDTFILKMIINGLTGDMEFKSIMILLLISLVLVVVLEWIHQLINEWSKAKLIPLSGRIQPEGPDLLR